MLSLLQLNDDVLGCITSLLSQEAMLALRLVSHKCLNLLRHWMAENILKLNSSYVNDDNLEEVLDTFKSIKLHLGDDGRTTNVDQCR